MNAKRNLLSDDWKRNWQQSIAVRISALALWIILPISLGITLYLISHLEADMKKQYVEKADVLAYQLQNYFDSHLFVNNKELESTVEQLMREHGFSYLKIMGVDSTWKFGATKSNTDTQARLIKISLPEKNTLTTIKIVGQHPEISTLVTSQRNKILYPVIFALVIFGFFLIWAIRSMVHRPLEKLVDATQAISDGITDLRLDTNRQDEFGYIARFFNEMLDKLLDQQEKLIEAAEEAKSANNAKSSFLANMSHELRTPLNAIIGYSDLLVEQARDLKQLEYVADLEKISTAGKYLLDLINNILDITKIETGKTEIYYEDIDIKQMIREITSTMAPLVNKNNNKFIIDLDPEIHDFRSDYTKLRQSLFNLLSNACKFTVDGIITLKVSKQKFNRKEKLIFKIIDTGTGMSLDCQNNLFVPFARGRNSNTLKISGTGLGLAISRHFCNLLGGEISVESTLGVGTKFTIHIPYMPVESQVKTEKASLAAVN